MLDLLHILSPTGPRSDAEVHFARLRRPLRACDEALNGTARNWLRRLPASRRPLHLCERYPRVANRIAWCWSDPGLAEQALDDLLIDRRGGREGFPPVIVKELRRLRDAIARN